MRREANAIQVRGFVPERIVISTGLDPYLSLRALAAYSVLSRRTLRTYLERLPNEALPCYRLGGKILVRHNLFRHNQNIEPAA